MNKNLIHYENYYTKDQDNNKIIFKRNNIIN